jgi:hypothetical protein
MSVVFCRRCKRMKEESQFYASNRSTCKPCKAQGNRERRHADPERTAKRRARSARERFLGEVGIVALGSVLTGSVGVLARLDAGELTVLEARSELFDIAERAIRQAETKAGVAPGDGMDIIGQRTRSRNHRESSL